VAAKTNLILLFNLLDLIGNPGDVLLRSLILPLFTQVVLGEESDSKGNHLEHKHETKKRIHGISTIWQQNWEQGPVPRRRRIAL
jgi:hypothetical protein